MRTILRIAALFLAIGVTVFWLFGGPNLGWTKNSVERLERDPVTEIDKHIFERRFVPGVDFLGAGLIASALIAGVSFFFARRVEASPTDSPGNPS
jgi:hypothetical protein